MPISTKNINKNGHNPDLQSDTEVAEAEVVEEEVFAQEPFTTFEELSSQPQEEKTVLRSLIPDTEEDFEFGYRILREHEYQSSQIPKDRTLYATRENASKNLFKISAARLGEHLKELANFKFPPNYLWDNQGLTPECMAELRIKIAYTSRKVFPTEDLRKYKRGQLGKVGVENPKYALRFKYWEQIAKRSEEYQNWVQTQVSDEEETQVFEAEWVFTENPEEREERHSKARSQIELSKVNFIQQVKNYFADVREEVLKIAEDEAIQTRLEMDKRHAQTLANPEELDEDEDL